MRPDGEPPDGLIARWREAGAWWEDEAPVEYVQWRDERGVRREKATPLPPLLPLPNAPTPYVAEQREEIALRPRKVRDEKVARACGRVAESPSVYSASKQASYAALHAMSGYAFGRSVLFAEEIARLAARHGCPAAAIADPFSLAGAVEFAREAGRVGVKPMIGASFEMPEGGEIVLIARDRRGYESLSVLITACHLEEPRLFPLASWERLERHARGLLCLTGGHGGPIDLALMARRDGDAAAILSRLVGIYGPGQVFVEVERTWAPWGVSVGARLLDLARGAGLAAVAGGPIAHARREQFPAQDVALCAQTLCLVDDVVGRKPQRHHDQPPAPERPLRWLNAERFFPDPAEMAARYADVPELIEATLRVAEMCDDDVLPARTNLPCPFDDPGQALRDLVWSGARLRHAKIDAGLRRRLETEIERIVRLNFASHFLVIWDACRWAGEQGIEMSGRGSVVDSAAAYCLGLSRIDAYRHRLHFDRFLPDDGSKRPDIDIDFEARRREDVREYLTAKYGVDRVATVAAFGAYCTRGIVREVGKALGLSPEAVGFLAKRLHGGIAPERLEAALDARPELQGSPIPRERFRWVFRLVEMLADVPRNLRAHSSGVVISDRPLAETVPVQWGATEVEDRHLRLIQWDKRSAKHYFDKFDILCLRGQDVLSGTQRRIRQQDPDFNVQHIPTDDPETYRAMRSGELIGIPQSASPAMRQAHQRLRTENLHDASLVQAGIRPGVGGAVKINELIARRRGLKPYSFEHPALERILGLTYGIIVFQEQVDQLLQEFGGYTSGEAEDIRDKIHKLRRVDYGQEIREELLGKIRARGFSESIAQHVFELVSGFKGYGFAQGHALAFAEISIRSIHCQQNFPAEYFAALLSAQPAGYYGPCTLANEARTRGVSILRPDVNRSREEFSVEDVCAPDDPKIVFPNGGIRIGLMQIKGLSAATRQRTVDERREAYASLFDFARRVRPERDELEAMVLAGCFDGLHSNRRSLLWAIPDALRYAAACSGATLIAPPEPSLSTEVEDFSQAERALREREVLELDVERHLMAFERERVASRGGVPSSQVRRLADRTRAIVVGNPIRLRFPPTPSGRRVVFFDLEDETGLLNVTCFDETYRRDGHAIVCSPYVTAIGHVQDRDGHTAFLASRVFPYRPCLLDQLPAARPLPLATADFLVG